MNQKSRIAILLLFLAASCGEPPRPHTWRDAVNVWSSAWCDHTALCQLDLYKKTFLNADACLTNASLVNCEPQGTIDCLLNFPNDWNLIEACDADMTDLACSASDLPASCIAAFAQ